MSAFDAFPEELRCRPQWIVWRREVRNGKATKVPYRSADTRAWAQTDDPATWSSFADAVAAVEADSTLTGIGYVFSAEDPFAGVDLDYAMHGDTLHPSARAVVEQLGSYTERSPSGNGVHVIVRGAMPDHEGRNVKGQPWGGGMEGYSAGRYFTVTGDQLAGAPGEVREAGDTLAQLFPPPPARASFPPAPPVAVQLVGIEDRAALDLLYRSARIGDKFRTLYERGFDAGGHGYESQSEADLWLAGRLAWATGCDPVHMDRLFRASALMRDKWDRKARGGETYGQGTIARAIAACTEVYEPAERSEQLADRFASPSEGGSVWPSPMRPEAFHGIAGEFVRAVETETEADPAALLLTFLAAAGSAIGAGPFVEVSGDRHPAKLWPVMVGETASGRKGTSLAWPRQVVELADPSWALRHAGNVGSGEVLVWAVRDRATKLNDEGQEVTTDAGVEDKRLFVVESEFSSVLRVSKRQGSVLSQVIRSAWDSDRLIHTAKQSPARCMSGAHVVVLGHITAEELRREMTAMDASNGLLNRFLFVAVRRVRRLPRGGQLPAGTLERFGERLAVFLDYARTRRRVERSPSFWTVWDPWYEREEHAGGLVAKVLGRAEPYVLRLALLFALLDGEDIITGTHARAALAVWEYVEASTRYVFGPATGDPVADRILGELRASPDGLTRTEIRDLFSRHSSGQVDHALEELRSAGSALMEKVSTGGRPSEVWRATKATKATKAPTEHLSSLLSLPSQPDPQLVRAFTDALRDGTLTPAADVSQYDDSTRQAWAEAVGRFTAEQEVAR